MPEWVDGPPKDELDDVRVELHALSTLGFYTPKGHKAYKKARKLDALLLPVRDRAREGLRDGAPTAALADCWRMIADAGKTIDRSRWWLQRGITTERWARQHVATVVRQAQKQQRSA